MSQGRLHEGDGTLGSSSWQSSFAGRFFPLSHSEAASAPSSEQPTLHNSPSASVTSLPGLASALTWAPCCTLSFRSPALRLPWTHFDLLQGDDGDDLSRGELQAQAIEDVKLQQTDLAKGLIHVSCANSATDNHRSTGTPQRLGSSG